MTNRKKNKILQITITTLLSILTLSGCNPFAPRSLVGGGDGSGANGSPAPVLVSPFYTNQDPITVVIEWTSAVTGFAVSDMVVSNGFAQNLTGSGSSYSFHVIPTASGDVRITFPSGSVTDSEGIENETAYALIHYTTEAPTVSVEQASGQADTTGTLPIEFDVNFSTAINTSSFTTADITNSGTSTGITWTITDSGDHKAFTLRATAISGYIGTVIPAVAAGSVADLAGNTNLVSTSIDNNVTYMTHFSDIRLWVKADSISAANGDPVTSWHDSGGDANHASELTNPPSFLSNAQNSLPAVRFTGGSQVMTTQNNTGITGNPDFTAFVVTRVNGTGTNYPAFFQLGQSTSTGQSARFGLEGVSANLYMGFYGGGSRSVSGYFPTFALYTWVRTSGAGSNNTQTGNLLFWVGVSAPVAGSLAAAAVDLIDGPVRIGRSTNSSINADIGEILIFENIAMTPTQRSEIEEYLNRKWYLY